MQINNLLFNFIKQNMPRETYEVNSIIEGKIVSIDKGVVVLDVNGEVMMAKTDIDLSELIGQEIDFVIQEKNGNKIIIKPLTEETIKEMSKEMETTINKTIKEFNLPKSEKAQQFIGALIDDKLPLSKENVESGMRIIGKLEDLLENTDKEVEVIELNNKETEAIVSGKNTENINLKKDLTLDKLASENPKAETSEKIVSENTDKNPIKSDENNMPIKAEKQEIIEGKIHILNKLMDLEKETGKELNADIKNILIKNENLSEKENINDKSKGLMEFIKNLKNDIKDEDIATISKFFVKNNIKPSLNNIKYTMELIKDPKLFGDEIKSIVTKLEKNEFLSKILGVDVEKTLKEKDGDKKISDLIKNIDIPKEVKQEILDTKNRLEFIKELNKEMYFQSIPLQYGKEKLQGFLNVIEEKENKFGANKPVSVFINLDTNNIGNISIACLAFSKELSLKIGIDEQDEALFKSLETVLKTRINKLGYSVIKLDYVFDKNIKAIENMDKSDSIYFLDIKV